MIIQADMTEVCIRIARESDIAEAARYARRVAETLGFPTVQTYYVATAASELAANLVIHAGGGVFRARALGDNNGLELITNDQGPGIGDIDKAMQDGYSTAGGLGCGLPGVQRLMDKVEIESSAGQGTHVRAYKWR